MTRAAFAVILKHSESIDQLSSIISEVETISIIADSELTGDDNVRQYLKELESNHDFQSLIKKWESASSIRKWTHELKHEMMLQLT